MDDNNDIRASVSDPSIFDPEADSEAIIKVIGVGGGGSNAVNYMYAQNIPHVDFVVCNTDMQALRMSPVPNKLCIGYAVTKGLGAGNVPDVGRECAMADEEAIRALFTPPTEMVFITAGMGGGTGTGAGPIVAQLAKDAGMLTIGIVTIPFQFEGDKKIMKAIEGAREMQKYVDALLVINNENLVDLYRDLNFFNAFEKADDTLANAARSISEIICLPCYINVDFRDVRSTLRNAGTAIISTAYGEGEHRITKAINNALHSPLLKDHDIYTSKRLMFKLSLNRKSASAIGEFDEIRQFTSQLPTIDVKWGVADDPTLGDQVKITMLASGFDLALGEGDDRKITGDSQESVIDFGTPKPPKGSTEEEEIKKTMLRIYGADKVEQQEREKARAKYAVLKPSQFDDEEVIRKLERTPTYKRNAKINEEILKGAAPESVKKPEDSPLNRDSTPSGDTITFT